jgi:hypothetical protein
MDAYDRALENRDWAPPGGCSMNEHDEVSRKFAADFAKALLAAIAEVPGLVALDITPESMHPFGFSHPRAYWEDRHDLAYWVRSTLEHNLHRPASLSRAALVAHYVPEEGPDCYPINEWLEPPPSFNVEVQADMLVGALKRHRRKEVLGS